MYLYSREVTRWALFIRRDARRGRRRWTCLWQRVAESAFSGSKLRRIRTSPLVCSGRHSVSCRSKHTPDLPLPSPINRHWILPQPTNVLHRAQGCVGCNFTNLNTGGARKRDRERQRPTATSRGMLLLRLILMLIQATRPVHWPHQLPSKIHQTC